MYLETIHTDGLYDDTSRTRTHVIYVTSAIQRKKKVVMRFPHQLKQLKKVFNIKKLQDLSK